MNFAEISKNSFSYRTPPVTTSKLNDSFKKKHFKDEELLRLRNVRVKFDSTMTNINKRMSHLREMMNNFSQSCALPDKLVQNLGSKLSRYNDSVGVTASASDGNVWN